MDFRGHGKSEGEPGTVPSIDILANDTITFHTKVMDKYYDKSNPPKIYVVCHSMGSMQFINILMRPGMNADGHI